MNWADIVGDEPAPLTMSIINDEREWEAVDAGLLVLHDSHTSIGLVSINGDWFGRVIIPNEETHQSHQFVYVQLHGESIIDAIISAAKHSIEVREHS